MAKKKIKNTSDPRLAARMLKSLGVSVVVSGALMLAGTAGAAPLDAANWGDQVLDVDTTFSSAISLWRDGSKNYKQALDGNLTINGATLTVTADSVLGNGNLFINKVGDKVGSLAVNNQAWLSQGSLTLTGGGEISVAGTHGVLVLATGNLNTDGAITTTGSGTVAVSGDVTAKSLNITGIGQTIGSDNYVFRANSVTALGANSTIGGAFITDVELGDANFGSKALTVTNTNANSVLTNDLTVGALTLGVAGASGTDAKVQVAGALDAASVSITGNTAGSVLTLGDATNLPIKGADGKYTPITQTSTVSGVTTITKGTLALVSHGADADEGWEAGSNTLTATGGVVLNGSAVANSVLSSVGGNNEIVGNISVASDKYGTIQAANGTTLKVGEVTVVGTTAGTQYLNIGAATTGTGTVIADKLTLTAGSALVDNGTLQIGTDKMVLSANTVLSVGTNGGVLHLTGGDYTYALNDGTDATGVLMNGGTLWVDGTLALTGTTSNTATINKSASLDNNTFKGNIVAKKLTTDSTNADGVTINGSTVQLIGTGTTTEALFTGGTDNAAAFAGAGTLILGATKDHNYGAEYTAGGVISKISDASSGTIQLAHGTTKITNYTSNGSGTLSFSDDTGFSSALTPNNITLSANTSNLTTAFTANGSVALGEGFFNVNADGGLTLVTTKSATINIADATKSGGLNKLTLADGGADGVATNAGNKGTYTIGTLVLGDVASKIDVSAGTVIADILDVNDKAHSGSLKASGTGTLVVNDIVTSTGTAKTAKFDLADTGTLLIGQNVTLGNGTFNIKTETSTNHTITDVAGTTLGSTGTLTVGTANTDFTVGVDAATSSTKLGLLASTLNIGTGTQSGKLQIGGGNSAGFVTIQGTGSGAAISNADKITVGHTSNEGTLTLGGTALGNNNGGTYAKEIALGTAANTGTLAFQGGDFKLDNITMATGNKATIDLKANGEEVSTLTLKTNSGTLAPGINLNGGNHSVNIGTDVGTLDAPLAATYNVVGGINVNTGTVTFGNTNTVNTLTGGIKLAGTNVGDAKLNVSNGNNTVDSLTVTTDKSGTVTLTGGSLNVGSALDLHLASTVFAGAATLSSGEHAMTLGTIGTGTSAGNTDLFAGINTIEAGSLTVQTDAATQTLSTISVGTAAAEVLSLAIGGGAVTASDFNINGGTVNLLGSGGNIDLKVVGASDATLDITGATSTLNVGSIAGADNAAISSNWSAGKVKVTSGTMDVINGSFGIADLTTVTGSDITVGTAPGEDDDNPKGTVGNLNIGKTTFAGTNDLTVNQGTVLFGSATAHAGFDTAFGAAFKNTNVIAGLGVVGAPVDLRNVTGKIGTSVQPADLFIINAANTQAIEFGADSFTYIHGDVKGIYQDVAASAKLEVDGTKNSYAITTGGNVFIDTGAQLYLDSAKAGRYLILDAGTSSYVAGMWNEKNVITNRLLDLNLKTDAAHKSVYADLAISDMTARFPGMTSSLGGIFAELARSGDYDPASDKYGIRFLSRIASPEYIASDRLAAATAEGAARFAAAGAVPTMTYGASSAVTDVVMQRTSLVAPLTQGTAIAMTDEGLALDANQGLSAGSMTPGFGLWAMPLYQNLRAKDLSAGNMQTGFKSDLYGMAIGADYTLPNNLRLGATFNVGAGESDSTGDFNRTQNDFDFVGLGLYAGWATGNFGLSADFAYTWSNNDVKQDLPASMLMANLKSDVDSSALSLGLRAEYKFTPAAGVDVVPHAGIRYTHLNTDSYNVKSAGNTVMNADSVTQNLVSFPLGVALSKDFNTSNGWLVKPQLDLGMTFTAGDIDFEQNVKVPGVNATARMDTRVLDRYTFDAGLGLSTEKNGVSFGLAYDLKIGKDTTSHGVNAMLRYKF